jgi:son of sevenless-like protein
VADVHAAKHVDIDGIQQEPGQSPAHDMYMQSVTEARELVRTLEAAVQAIYDDSSSLLVAAQGLRQVDHDGISEEYYINCRRLNSLASTLDANASLVFQTLDALVNIGLNQANIAGRDHRQSILWRESRRSMIETRMRSLAAEDEVVGMEDAFSPKGVSRFDVYNAQDRPMLEDIPPTPTWNGSEAFTEDIPKNTKASVDDLPDEEDECEPSRRR